MTQQTYLVHVESYAHFHSAHHYGKYFYNYGWHLIEDLKDWGIEPAYPLEYGRISNDDRINSEYKEKIQLYNDYLADEYTDEDTEYPDPDDFYDATANELTILMIYIDAIEKKAKTLAQ